jgi:hypothetical protein
MPIQFSVAIRNALLDAIETQGGTLPFLDLFNGTLPATCATANAGTQIASGQLPSDWMAAAGSGAKAKTGTWTTTGVSGAGAGTAAQYWRLFASDHTTCIAQGSVGPASNPTQAGTWSANSTAVTLSGTNSAIVVGMTVTGTGIQAGTYVSAISGTALTLSQNALVAGSGTTLTFAGDMTLDNTSVANNQIVTASSFTLTAGNS